MNDVHPLEPSLWYCAIGALVIAAGIGGAGLVLYRNLSTMTDGLVETVVPGGKSLTLMPRSNYTVFLETNVVVDGRIYTAPDSIEGLRCTMTTSPSGSEILLSRSSVNTTYDFPSRQGRSILSFATTDSESYHLACDYNGREDGPQVVLAIASGMEKKIIGGVLGGLAFLFGGFFGGGLVIALVVAARERSRRRASTLGLDTAATPNP